MGPESACVYCLATVPIGEGTDDHVIARSWYPANTPPDEKWTATSCKKCNNEFSAVEKRVLTRLALCMDVREPALKEIIASALRSMSPGHGKSPRDAEHRAKNRERITNEIVGLTDSMMGRILPAFRKNFDSGSRSVILISSDDLNILIEKWVRGLHACLTNMPVKGDYNVDVYLYQDEGAANFYGPILHLAETLRNGPGVEVLRWHAVDGEKSITEYAFNIWGEFRVYGRVTNDPDGLLQRMTSLP